MNRWPSRFMFDIPEKRLSALLADLASIDRTGRTVDGRRIRPLTDREMAAEHVNFAKRQNYYDD